MLFHFYDIESLHNVFMLADLMPEQNKLDIYYLIDNPELLGIGTAAEITADVAERVHLRNLGFKGDVYLKDLHYEPNVKALAKEMGVSLRSYGSTDPALKDKLDNEYRLRCTTDPDYNEDTDPYLMGYNSFNYDTTMYAKFMGLYFSKQPVSAEVMRDFNDLLFSSKYKKRMPRALDDESRGSKTSFAYRIRKNMLLTGRHLDVAALNEKQKQVALKRLLGMLGYQILESDKLDDTVAYIRSLDDLCELIAYNASDVINLQNLFNNSLYQAQFSLKRQLLQTYPQIVYQPKLDDSGKETYEADIRPSRVRRDRLVIDSTSAQFATKCLCPYGHLSDIPAVSFMYPSERKAKELGIKRVNVLEETKKFFYANITDEDARKKFDAIYAFYKSLEGKNFNASDNYREDYGRLAKASTLDQFNAPDMMIPYYDANGKPTTCFAVFSTGGLHGAEYNKALYDHDMEVYKQKAADMAYVQSVYPDPVDLRKAKTITMPDGRKETYKTFLMSGCTMKKASYREIPKPYLSLYEQQASRKEAVLKKNPKAKVSSDPPKSGIVDDYVYTSADHTNHEDFTSYYPNMLRMMSAFYNPGLGYDRYAEIFDQKQKYGKLMKDKSLPQEQRDFYKVLREGTKLILNSASGAADTNFGSPIQMNNRILSMRIIGNLFTWRIGQAQALQGARITSTNTDGLYSVMEATRNNEILAKESANIGVEIEPEPLYLISKDSNNRLELDETPHHVITSAGGGSVACRRGPTAAKALSHPAIIDYAISEYLRLCALWHNDNVQMDKPFDREIGLAILNGARDKFRKAEGSAEKGDLHWALMFQNIIASSPATFTFHFAREDGAEDSDIQILAHYNRTFIIKPEAGGVHMWAAGTRASSNGKIVHDDLAMKVMEANGVKESDIADRNVIIMKINKVDPEWNMLILNRSLYELSPDELDALAENINMDAYLQLLENEFEGLWRNHLPNAEEKPEVISNDAE